jgi:cytochrome c553
MRKTRERGAVGSFHRRQTNADCRRSKRAVAASDDRSPLGQTGRCGGCHGGQGTGMSRAGQHAMRS